MLTRLTVCTLVFALLSVCGMSATAQQGPDGLIRVTPVSFVDSAQRPKVDLVPTEQEAGLNLVRKAVSVSSDYVIRRIDRRIDKGNRYYQREKFCQSLFGTDVQAFHFSRTCNRNMRLPGGMSSGEQFATSGPFDIGILFRSVPDGINSEGPALLIVFSATEW